jgi:hypothetical protein
MEKSFFDLLFIELFTSFFYTFLVDCRYELLIDLCCLMPLWKAVLCIFLYFLYFISPRTLPDVAWTLEFFVDRQTSAFFIFFIHCITACYYCLTLTDAAWSQTYNGHSTLRYVAECPCIDVPVDFWYWMCAPPQPLYARVGVWHRSTRWLIREEIVHTHTYEDVTCMM